MTSPTTPRAESVRPATTEELSRLAAGQLRSFRVEGHSMWPVLREGDVVLVDPDLVPAPGEVAVAHHPFRESYLVKHVTAIEEDGGVVLIGESRFESTDSRTLGPFSPERVVGRVIARHVPAD